jgi:hypothetical protein
MKSLAIASLLLAFAGTAYAQTNPYIVNPWSYPSSQIKPQIRPHNGGFVI